MTFKTYVCINCDVTDCVMFREFFSIGLKSNGTDDGTPGGRYATGGRGYFAECGLRNAESCQGVICGKSSAECSAKYPLIAFPHSTAEKFRIFASFTVELSFDDLIWLDIDAYFNL